MAPISKGATAEERTKKKARTSIFSAWRKRTTELSNIPGYWALSIFTLNRGNFIQNERKGDITHEPHRGRIHIAAIQETHIPNDQPYVENGYRVITTAARKTNSANNIKGMCQGGVAILVFGDMQRHIKEIARIGRRILKIIFSAKNAVAPIAVLAAYAPHNGYTLGRRTQHWKLSKETIEQIQTTNLCTWRADANAPIGNRRRNDSIINKIIGMGDMARIAEPGSGRQLQKYAQRTNSPPSIPGGDTARQHIAALSM